MYYMPELRCASVAATSTQWRVPVAHRSWFGDAGLWVVDLSWSKLLIWLVRCIRTHKNGSGTCEECGSLLSGAEHYYS